VIKEDVLNQLVKTYATPFLSFEAIKSYLEEVIVHSTLGEEFLSEFSELNDGATMQARHQYFEVPDSTPEHYKESIFYFDGKPLVAGIRHLGANKELPFVKLTPGFRISGSIALREVYKSIENEFKVFNPQWISLVSDKLFEKSSSCRIGHVTMVNRAETIMAMAPWSLEKQLFFEEPEEDFYRSYCEDYWAFHQNAPELKDKVTILEEDDFSSSLSLGLTKEIYLGGERVGLVSAERNPFLGHDGLYFIDLVLSEKWKGRGLAKAIQRRFISDECQGDEFVWGTIDNDNVPSYKTAVKNLRSPLAYEYFVKAN